MPQPPDRNPREPRFTIDLEQLEVAADVFADEALHEGVRLDGVRFAPIEAENVEFKRFVLTEVDLSAAKLDHLDLEDGSITGCDLANLRSDSCTFECVVIEASRLTGAQLSQGNFTGSAFRGCRLAGVNGFEALKGAQMAWEDVMELATALAAGLGIEVRDDIS